ncbi:MAG: tetratricopeptide repeat protein [Methanobrevibacter sp.]|nr:tetratricopeptide repeat protein [Methanobrevibacter sp.]
MSKRSKEKLLKKMDKEMDNSNFKRVIKLANEIIKLDPAQSEAYICKFISLMKLEKETEASNLFEDILDNLSTIKDIGDVEDYLLYMKEYDKANALYNKVYELDSDFYGYLETALINYIEFDTAIEFLNHLDKNTPRWEDLYFLKAVILSAAEEYEETIDVCDEILKDFPNHENAYSKKTFCLSALDRDEELKEILEYRIKNNIRPNWALVDKGGYYLKKGDYDKAISIVDEVLERKPGFGYALFSRANFMCIENKDLNEALDYLNQALEGEVDKRYYTVALGLKYNILDQLGRKEEAEKALEEYNSATMGGFDI